MTDTTRYNESELFQLIAKGDQSAYSRLFQLYEGRVFAVAYKMTKSRETAEEIAQETFLNIWQHRDKLSDVQDASAYLFTIAYNIIFRFLKKVAREENLLQELISNARSVSNSTDETILFRERQAIIDKAIQQLPPQRRLIFVLSRLQGLKHEEIANLLDISPNTVKNQLVIAQKTLRTLMGDGGEMAFLLLFLLK